MSHTAHQPVVLVRSVGQNEGYILVQSWRGSLHNVMEIMRLHLT